MRSTWAAPRTLEALLKQAVAARDVTVDIAGVRFIDSTVISAFVKARNSVAACGRRFAVINPGAQVRRVLQITGVLDALAEDAA